MHPLYIDPGTGSALFSILIGIAAASYFLFRSVYLKLKTFIFSKEKIDKTRQKYIIYAEDKRYWPFFEPVLNEVESRKIEVLYITSSEDDPIFNSNYTYIKGKLIGKGNKAFAYLNFLSADFVLTTTPHLDVLQWKRSKNVKHYCHLVHSLSGAVLYKLFALDYFDSVIVSNTEEKEEIKYLENFRKTKEKQIIVAGYTFFDNYIKKIHEIKKDETHEFTVLLSPSWGQGSLLNQYGARLIEPLAKTGWKIIIRPHPQSLISEKEVIDNLTLQFKNAPNIEWDYSNENIYTLSKSDIMISDFSGIIFDFVFLFDKPVIINLLDMDMRRFDCGDMDRETFYIKSMKNIGVQLDASNLDNIKNIIESVIQNTELQKTRQEIKNKIWENQGESAKRIADFMERIVG